MWTSIKTFKDIKLEKTEDGIGKLTINRPEVRNAFRPQTVKEMLIALEMLHEDPDVGVIFLDNLARWRAGEALRNVVDPARGY